MNGNNVYQFLLAQYGVRWPDRVTKVKNLKIRDFSPIAEKIRAAVLHRKSASAAMSRDSHGVQWSTEINAQYNESGIASPAEGVSPSEGLLSTSLALYLTEVNTKAPQLNGICFKVILYLCTKRQ